MIIFTRNTDALLRTQSLAGNLVDMVTAYSSANAKVIT